MIDIAQQKYVLANTQTNKTGSPVNEAPCGLHNDWKRDKIGWANQIHRQNTGIERKRQGQIERQNTDLYVLTNYNPG